MLPVKSSLATILQTLNGTIITATTCVVGGINFLEPFIGRSMQMGSNSISGYCG
jgi:hypothetical protein